MTAPGHSLGAHDSHAMRSRGRKKPLQALPKRIGLHMIGVAAKARVSPAGVRRIGSRPPQPAQFGEMLVSDMFGCETDRQRIAVELSGSARTRHRAGIGD